MSLIIINVIISSLIQIDVKDIAHEGLLLMVLIMMKK